MAFSGSQLKKIREERNISLEEVASATRIRLATLQDLEDEVYSELSSSTQTKGFLRLYADFLGVEEPSVEEINISSSIPDAPSEKPKTLLEDIAEKTRKKPPKKVKTSPAPPAQEEPAPANEPSQAESSEQNSESAEELMAIGRELAARRRYLNITWEVIEEETHIPRNQLKNIERGDLDALINPMQFKGHLQSYARFLNLDVAGIMIRYADVIQKRRLEKNTQKQRRFRPPKVLPPFLVNLKRFFTLDLFFGSLMIIGIVGFLIWGISRMTFPQDETEVTGTLPPVAEVLLAEPTGEATEIAPTETAEVEQVIPTATPFYSASETESNLEIVLLIRQNVWLRITSDGDVIAEGRQLAGNVLTYTGEDEIELETGNVSAIEIIFNQRSIEPLSDTIGTPARLLFTAEGMTELSLLDTEETP
ncbi:MAG: DUF4115 domain-containing protein [Anaerolineaceae bacterium]|nr:DUF4115 domain-containing protein [Anaerolineaceae bacterium]MDD4041900.1 DUF4115 domain-containing protein [Anaerolineaceae bacterium]MDD4578223.1 DUF4115 domain-containing protein [Anaerolineaceae bacterium]